MSKAHCKGCGAVLQNVDDTLVGYSPDLSKDYCQACFRLAHYGEVKDHFHPDRLPELKSKSLALMVSSVLQLDMLFFYPLHRYAPDVTYTYIINQVDLLPDSTNLDKLLENIMDQADAMQIPYQDIILMSAKNPYDIENLKDYIASYKVSNVYLLGVQNAGKTTLYKALVNDPKALAMNKAGLTQEALSAQLSPKQKLYDMPGLYQEGYLHQLLDYDIYKKLLPSKPLKPMIYQLKAGQALMFEGLIGLSVNTDTSVVGYLSESVQIHRTNKEKLSELIKNQVLKDRVYAPPYETRTFTLDKGKQQVTFADFGCVHMDGPLKITLTYPKALHVSVTEALFS